MRAEIITRRDGFLAFGAFPCGEGGGDADGDGLLAFAAVPAAIVIHIAFRCAVAVRTFIARRGLCGFRRVGGDKQGWHWRGWFAVIRLGFAGDAFDDFGDFFSRGGCKSLLALFQFLLDAQDGLFIFGNACKYTRGRFVLGRVAAGDLLHLLSGFCGGNQTLSVPQREAELFFAVLFERFMPAQSVSFARLDFGERLPDLDELGESFGDAFFEFFEVEQRELFGSRVGLNELGHGEFAF